MGQANDLCGFLAPFQKLLLANRGRPTAAFFDRFLKDLCKVRGAALAQILLFSDKPSPLLNEPKRGSVLAAHTFRVFVSPSIQDRLSREEQLVLKEGYQEVVLAAGPGSVPNTPCLFNNDKPLPSPIRVVLGVPDVQSQDAVPMARAAFCARFTSGDEKLSGVWVGGTHVHYGRLEIIPADVKGSLQKWRVGGPACCPPMPPMVRQTLAVPLRHRCKADPVGLLTLGFAAEAPSPTVDDATKVLGQFLAGALQTLFSSTHSDILNRLHESLLKRQTYDEKIHAICEAAAYAMAAEVAPRARKKTPGTYAHIRTFIPADIHGGAGLLRMDSNYGFNKPADKLDESQKCRTVNKTPDKEKDVIDELARIPAARHSISHDTFVWARFWRHGYEKKEVSLPEIDQLMRDWATVEPAKRVHAQLPRGGSRESRDDTQSVISVPLLDGDCSVLGTLTVNSRHYGWLNCHWLDVAIYLAKEVSLVILHQQGLRTERNVDLTFDETSLREVLKEPREHPPLRRKQLKQLMRGIYRDNWLYEGIEFAPLGGHGEGYAFKVIVRRQGALNIPRFFYNVVRVVPRENALAERRKYERLKTVLDSGRFVAKVGEEVQDHWGAIAYVFLGGSAADSQNLEHTLDLDGNSKNIKNRLRTVGLLMKDLYEKVLRNLHVDGPGAYGAKENPPQKPSIVELYERPRFEAGARIPKTLAYVLDIERPGLFDDDQLRKAVKETYSGDETVTTFVQRYRQLRDSSAEKISTLVSSPQIGLVHGDLHPRNVLVTPDGGGRSGEPLLKCWVIDYDRFHRGHVFQDFARLESYAAHRLLTQCDDPTAAIQNIVDGFGDDFSGSPSVFDHTRFPDGDQVKQLRAILKEHGWPAAYYAGWRIAIRCMARELCDALKSGEGTRGPGFQYNLALVFQYLDWTTFSFSKDPGAEPERHIKGVSILAWDGMRLLKKMFPQR